jgi:hypoxanthine phosphoribosyltransferase
MTKKAYYTWEQVEGMTQDILRQIRDEKFDAVVGLTRGGLTPAVLVSQYLDIPMHTLKVSLRDHQEQESLKVLDKLSGQRVLVIDDINDTGATINYIKEHWIGNLTYAVLINNEASDADVDYSSININKMEDDVWIVFPWEDWWK